MRNTRSRCQADAVHPRTTGIPVPDTFRGTDGTLKPAGERERLAITQTVDCANDDQQCACIRQDGVISNITACAESSCDGAS